MKTLYKVYILFASIFLINIDAYCQCTISGLTMPTTGTCTSGCTANATDGMNINSAGSVYCYASTGTFLSGLTVSNGTLRVCGNLTLSSLTFANNSNAGNIIIESGGTLTINSDLHNFYNNKSIRVYGTLNLNGNTTVDVGTAGIIIESSGKVNSANLKTLAFKNYGNGLINRGQLYVNGTFTATSGLSVCLEKSYMSVDTLNIITYEPLTFAGTSGTAVILISGRFNNTSSLLTSSSSISLCNNGCSSANGCGTAGNGNTWDDKGSAVGYTSVGSSCARTVPVLWGNIKAEKKENIVEIKWTTIQENNNDYFIVEESTDGENYSEKAKIKGVGNADIPLFYSTTFFTINEGTTYFRIKQVDLNGISDYSNVFSVSDYHAKSFLIYPNPVDKSLNQLFLENHGEEDIHISVYTSLGQIVSSGDIRVAKNEIIDIFSNLHNLVSGIYEVKLTTSTEVHVEKIEVK